MNTQIEDFKRAIFFYFNDWLLLAELTTHSELLLLVKPFLSLTQVMAEICDNLVDMVEFNQPLTIKLIQFGNNEIISLSIN